MMGEKNEYVFVWQMTRMIDGRFRKLKHAEIKRKNA
jgi:hypothetical protein